jgi:hypothetical protein
MVSALPSLSPELPLWMRFPVVTITLANVLPVAVVVAVQSTHYQGVRPYPGHLFVDVLAKVSYVKNATSVAEMRINQIPPEAFEDGKGDLSFVCVHWNTLHCEELFG